MFLMRQIEVEIRPEWEKAKSVKKETEKYEDCEPNMLLGWTDKNPSLWDVSCAADKPTITDILVALFRRKKNGDKIAYLKFSSNAVEKAKLVLAQTNGNTGIQQIDLSKTHFELTGITAKQLCTLIYHILCEEYETGVFKKSDFDKIVFDIYDKYHVMQVASSGTAIASAATVAQNSTKIITASIEESVKIVESSSASGTKS
jgi:hypothetical protein